VFYNKMDGSTLPKKVRRYIAAQQATPEWRTNQYRLNGVLRETAFYDAFEKKRYEDDWYNQPRLTSYPAMTLADLQQTVNQQTPKLWEQYPWKHYNVTSTVFTLAELAQYVRLRTYQSACA
jgi:hypothetical protein